MHPSVALHLPCKIHIPAGRSWQLLGRQTHAARALLLPKSGAGAISGPSFSAAPREELQDLPLSADASKEPLCSHRRCRGAGVAGDPHPFCPHPTVRVGAACRGTKPYGDPGGLCHRLRSPTLSSRIAASAAAAGLVAPTRGTGRGDPLPLCHHAWLGATRRAGDTLPSQPAAHESHRVVRVGRDLKNRLIQPLAIAGPPLLNRVAGSPTQTGLDVPALGHPHLLWETLSCVSLPPL